LSEAMSGSPIERVRLAPDGLRLGNQHLPLLAASMHYHRIPRARWGKCLDAIAELGLPIVESPVPWSVHELGEGAFELGAAPRGSGRGPASGRDQQATGGAEQRDLLGFLEAAAARGLKVLLSPGPQLAAGLDGGGFPERVLADERCLARGAGGNPAILPVPPRAFPAPSYASERFLDQACAWLAAVAAFLRGRCWPDGPVVALRLDSACGSFYRGAAYDLDYHPDAVALYRAHLGARYPGGLPAGYGAAAAAAEALATLEPPRRFDATTREELSRHLDWLAFKEQLAVRALRLFAKTLLEGGVDLPLLGDAPLVELAGGLPGLPALEEPLAAVGLDLFTRRGEHRALAGNLRRLAGSSRFPFVAELGWGGWPWWWPRGLESSRATALGALMHGARGFTLVMGVERDRWYGAPIDAEGLLRPESGDFLRGLIAALRAVELPSLQRRTAVGLLRVRELERLALCANLLDPVPPAAAALVGLGAEELGAELPGLEAGALAASSRFERAAEAALGALQVPYDLVDSEAAAERLAAYRLLVAPSLELCGRGLLDRLAGFVAGGGVLLLGPRQPRWDERGGELGELPPNRLVEEPALRAALEEELSHLGLQPALRVQPAGVEVSAFFEERGGLRCLFVANRTAARLEAAVEGELAGLRAWDALSGAPLDLGRVALGAGELRMVRLATAAAGEGGQP
jgi:beta-galactosidase